MQIALFDLDNTLIAGDSDCLWGKFMTEKGLVNAEDYENKHERFYQDYLQGQLNVNEFLGFQLATLVDRNLDELLALREEYTEKKILPILLKQAEVLVDQHREQGHELMIITATNRFLTEPIAKLFGIKHLIACEPEFIDGNYTGKVSGIPSCRDGKVSRFRQWLEQHEKEACETWFYSDSHNDIPLLEIVDHAIAVDPDETLRNTAKKNKWQIITLRD